MVSKYNSLKFRGRQKLITTEGRSIISICNIVNMHGMLSLGVVCFRRERTVCIFTRASEEGSSLLIYIA